MYSHYARLRMMLFITGFLTFLPVLVPAETIGITWELFRDYDDRTAQVGDIIEFRFSDGSHDVWRHETNTCSTDDAMDMGSDAPVRYTVTTEDDGKDLFFTCQVGFGAHCNLGQRVRFTIGGTGDNNDIDDDFRLICLSGLNTVDTPNGAKLVQDLEIGDLVRASDDTFSQVYSFGHYDTSVKANFLQIHTETNVEPLEISASHLIQSQGKYVAAEQLKVGDRVSSGMVTKITNVERQGLYAPITYEGTIVANGVKTSSYVKLLQTPRQHETTHILLAPLRVYCRFLDCSGETYEQGISTKLFPVVDALRWLNHRSVWFQGFIVLIALPVPLMFYGYETLSFSVFAAVGLVVLVALQGTRQCKKTKFV